MPFSRFRSFFLTETEQSELGVYSVDFMGYASKLLQINPSLTPNQILNFAAADTLKNKKILEEIERARNG